MVRNFEFDKKTLMNVYLESGEEYIGVDIPPKPIQDGFVAFFRSKKTTELVAIPIDRILLLEIFQQE